MPRHRLFTTRLTNNTQTSDSQAPDETFSDLALTAALSAAVTGDCRFAPSPAPKEQLWVWPAAFLLHAVIIALALITLPSKPPVEASSPPGVSVVFDNGGAQQTAAPQAQRQGPPIEAQVPPPAAPPPPTEALAQPPEVNLNLPVQPLAPLSLPAPQQQTQPRHVQNTKPAPSQYQVMNNMSLGKPSPLVPNAKHGINLQLSQSDLNAMNSPEITVQGEIGADWMAGFSKWVNDHTYYPQAAVEQGQEGTSTIEFTVHRDGQVTGLHLLNSAGSPFLDQAWMGIFAQNKVPPFPPGTKSDTLKITASLQYEIIH